LCLRAEHTNRLSEGENFGSAFLPTSTDDLPFRALLPTVLRLGLRFANRGGVNEGLTDGFAMLGQTAEAARLCESEALPFTQR